ncbi:MAG: HNH endonuclease [Verrucomicrobiaceae bacterium]|nr:HNH endonuclease [Verrucomicrobiaceae bacterium]
MSPKLRQTIRRRARFRCEYCRMPENKSDLRFQVDHVVAEKHGGPTAEGNLAWTCYRCNSCKGPNIAGLDNPSGGVFRLFHPRKDRWAEHFRWSGARLIGRTAVGRATVEVLRINHPESLLTRQALMDEGIEF